MTIYEFVALFPQYTDVTIIPLLPPKNRINYFDGAIEDINPLLGCLEVFECSPSVYHTKKNDPRRYRVNLNIWVDENKSKELMLNLFNATKFEVSDLPSFFAKASDPLNGFFFLDELSSRMNDDEFDFI